jgi:hypothetical protein
VTSTDTDMLIGQLISGQATATAGVLERARSSQDPILLVAATLVGHTRVHPATTDLMARAAACAASTRDRQLVAIAFAHLAGETDRVDALAREHLIDYPDSVLVSWLASAACSEVLDRIPIAHNLKEKS